MRVVARMVLTSLLLAAAGCSSLFPREAPKPINSYMLEEAGDITARDKPACAAISVTSVRAAPGYGSARMIYSRGDHRLDYFAYHKWADSPSNMLFPLQVSALERSGRFKAVLPPSAPEAAPLRLDTELVWLRQVFGKKKSQIELSLRARLYAEDQIVGTKLFALQEEAGSGPETGVAAANRATGKLMVELVTWLDEVTGKLKGPCQ